MKSDTSRDDRPALSLSGWLAPRRCELCECLGGPRVTRVDLQRFLEMTDRTFLLARDTEQRFAEKIVGFRIVRVEGNGPLERFNGSSDVVLCLRIVVPHKASSVVL